MKVVFITGDHRRHEYLVSKFSKLFSKILWFKQKRNKIKKVKKYKHKSNLQKLYEKHLDLLDKSEKKYFKIKKYNEKKIKVINIEQNQLNELSVLDEIKKFKPVCLITFGCKKLKKKYFSLNIKYLLNIHGGLSPWYRGSITNFWPSYLLEPNFTGVTLHHLSDKIDGGNILFQTAIKPNKNDGIQDNHCKAILNFCKFIPNKFAKILKKKKKEIGFKQLSSGRIWTHKMWNPSLLDLIYKKYNNKINKYWIENNLKKYRKPYLKNVC